MADLRGRPVLVTGGTGFIGSHLVRRLVGDGARVSVLVRPGSDLRLLGDARDVVRVLPGDLTDAGSVTSCLEASGAEVVFHLAGDTAVRRLDDALSLLERSVAVNLQGTLNVVRAAHLGAAPVQRLVRLGGLEEYGRGPVPYDEAQRERPVSPYSASQVAATHYGQMLQPYLAFDLVTLRPALVYGPGQSTAFLIPAFITRCLHGEDFELTAGGQSRDLLYVGDVVEACVRAAGVPGVAGEVVNVSSGREYRIRDVAETIHRMIGSETRLLVGAEQERPSEVHHLYGRNDKAKALLGWTPTTGLDEGLARTIAWYREHVGPSVPAPA